MKQNKIEEFNKLVVPAIENIDMFCRMHKIPMIMVFCIGAEKVGINTIDMDMVGFINLDVSDKDNPMVKAANILQIPIEPEDKIPADMVH